MTSNIRSSALPIRAHLSSIEVVGELEEESSTTRPDHYAIVYVDEQEVAKSEKKPRVPAPHWGWPGDHQFRIHPSSTIKVVIYRETRARVTKNIIGQHTAKAIELLENDGNIGLINKAGIEIASKIKIDLSLIAESEDQFESFMATVSADASRLDGAVRIHPGILALGRVLQLTKIIMDIAANAGSSPILKATWGVMSAVYTAIRQIELQDNTVRDLVESLREMLGIAKEYPDLLLIKGTTNVIEEIGRTSLKVASLIHEYTRQTSFRRTISSQASDTMKLRIADCQKSCDDLRQKFNTRVNMDTNLRGARTQGIVTEIKGTMNANNANIQSMLNTIKDVQLADKVYQWLSAPDSSKNYHEACEKRQKDTCGWFLDGERFRELQEKAGFLWIKGTAGCGKTILCSSIIDKIIQLHRENNSITYGYFFFDGRDSQNDLQLHDKLIRSLILQISLQCDGIPAALVQLYGHGYQQPSTNSLEDTLYRIIDGLDLAYIVIDSLDECIEREKMLRWINQITSRRIGNLRMVVISRPERDIEDALQPLDPDCIDLAKEHSNHDITTYLEEELSALSAVKKWDEGTRTIIKSMLTERAEGMFRWVALQLMELKKCSNHRSVLNQLENLPKGLYETYDRILSKIDNEADRTDTKTFLRWLCFSVRPMELAELTETITVDFDTENGPQYRPAHRYWNQRDVLEKCAGLITESEEFGERTVKLAHFSIKEYLLSDHLCLGATPSFHLASAELAHSSISQTCLVYLLQFNAPGSVDSNVATSFPLARYAAEHWVPHAHSGGIDNLEPSCTLTLAKKLFMPNSATLPNWVRLWDCDGQYATFENFKTEPDLKQTTFATALYYTSLLGLHRLSLHLSKEVDVNAQGGRFGTALQAASHGGHEAVVKLLVEQGADVNAQGGYYSNALQAASASWTHSDKEIVKLLLKNGAAVNAQGGYYGNALQASSVMGEDQTVELLLQNGADVNVQGGYYGNALQAASYSGKEETVELLLKNGADVNAQGGEFGNALQAASYEGNATVELLLKHGADVNAQGGYYGNALQAASYEGKEATVELLLKNGADIHAQGEFYGTALQAASFAGRVATVDLLLKNGADVHAQGGYHGNALQAASCMGKEAIVEVLLKNGADVNAHGGEFGNALQAASFAGRDATVELLLKNGADIHAQGGEFGNALQAASYEGKDATVEQLLKNGADVHAQGGKHGHALQAASFKGRDTTVELLLKHGADVHAQAGQFGNALQAASYEGRDATVELLLKNGADVNAQGGPLGNALQAASCAGKEAIVQLLLKNGADVHAQGGHYSHALQAASFEGREATVELLLKNGADVHAQGGKSGNALQAASHAGKEAIVELLLKNGADVNAQGGEYGNALQAASFEGREATVELLLKNGADVNAQGGAAGSALQAASYEGRDAIVELLLKHGADVHAQGGPLGNALQAGSYTGKEAIVELLLKNGADVHAQGGHYGSALQAATTQGHDRIVKLLLANGADKTIAT
ncbi:ankyrin repeat-containing domain protein [Pholiota molesta]|nr:ankyrin repeat-containing domain protein [Pholiota molesta]